jgi:hypothetical protein
VPVDDEEQVRGRRGTYADDMHEKLVEHYFNLFKVVADGTTIMISIPTHNCQCALIIHLNSSLQGLTVPSTDDYM